MNRRGFLLGAGGILASFAAPAIVRADSLMRVVPRDTTVIGLDLAGSLGDRTAVVLLRGEIGRYEGVRFIEHARDVEYYEGLQWAPNDLEGMAARTPLVVNLVQRYLETAKCPDATP